MTRSQQVQEAHERITALYSARAFAALDRGDRQAADTWLARLDAADARTQEHRTFVELTSQI